MKWWTRYRRRRKGLCPDCGEGLSLRQLEYCEDSEEVTEEVLYETAVSGLPCLACSDLSHRKRLPRPTFEREIARFLEQAGTFPISKVARRGFFPPSDCYHCGARLRKQKAQLRHLEGTIELDGLPAFHVKANEFSLHCDRCDLWQFDGGLPASEILAGRIISLAETANVWKDG